MQPIDARILFEPTDESLRYLPEGPYRCPDGRISWVAIQHGPSSPVGSLNLYDLATGQNESFPLPGRPGFAFPTRNPGEFILGLERSLVLYDTHQRSQRVIVTGIDQDVTNTIINDGVVFDGHLVFGCKDLAFAEQKAGLYLLRAGDDAVVQLSDRQICSNGKAAVQQAGGQYILYDIDSPSQKVLAWELDAAAGTLSRPQTVVDLSDEEVVPDGMILTPDRSGVVVALYDPRPSAYGEARWYDIETGELRGVWRCDRSPRVTCPQLVQIDGITRLLLTTADEGMSTEWRQQCSHAGCLFIAETTFDGLNDNPRY